MFLTYAWPNRADIDRSYTIADHGVTQKTLVAHSVASVFDLFDQYTVSSRDISMSSSGYELNIEDFTIKYEKIWAVCKETYSGDSARVLKVINPRTEFTKPYLETLTDIVLATGNDIIGGVSSVGFSKTEPNTLVVGLTGSSLSVSGHTVRAYKDYFYVEDSTRQVFMREFYTGHGESVVII